MQHLILKIEEIKAEFRKQLAELSDATSIEQTRVAFLGRKGKASNLLRLMGTLSESERPMLGQLANELRHEIESSLSEASVVINEKLLASKLQRDAVDITLSGNKRALGGVHPLTQVIRRMEDIFIGMGYRIAEGPEIELTKFNFDALRMYDGHPARTEQDTFYVRDDLLLRTQTSPVQIRVMRQQKPPIRILCPGRVYRADEIDATHSPVFHQMEGLVVDEGITMGDLIGTLQLFARELFGSKSKIRLRPHHFPFTEPSCEIDISCWSCDGQGDSTCKTCRGEGFVEILGAGMVHPQILDECGIDSQKYTGFAFGVGVERTAAGVFGVPDLRYFFENDIRFLQQFSGVEGVL